MALASKPKGCRLLSELKQHFVSPGREPRKIPVGLFQGIVMNLELQNQTQVYLGLWEREVQGWVARLSEGVSTVIDIGAGHGEYTLFFLKRTMAQRIYAFEPDKSSYALLCQNLELNGLSHSERLSTSGTFVGDSDTADTIRLDSLAQSVRVPCLIKMDVDGAEVDILRGANELNAMPDVRWLIETHGKDLEDACVETLAAAGFRTTVIQNAWWRLFVPEGRIIPHNRWLAAWKA